MYKSIRLHSRIMRVYILYPPLQLQLHQNNLLNKSAKPQDCLLQIIVLTGQHTYILRSVHVLWWCTSLTEQCRYVLILHTCSSNISDNTDSLALRPLIRRMATVFPVLEIMPRIILWLFLDQCHLTHAR